MVNGRWSKVIYFFCFCPLDHRDEVLGGHAAESFTVLASIVTLSERTRLGTAAGPSGRAVPRHDQVHQAAALGDLAYAVGSFLAGRLMPTSAKTFPSASPR